MSDKRGETLASKNDWKAERDRVDLAAVATSLMGPPPGRRGERGRRLWWPCPFHNDRNPSFLVDLSRGRWHCFGCGAAGDSAELVMRLTGATFPEAVERLTDSPERGRVSPPPRRPQVPAPLPKLSPAPSGLPEDDALAVVGAATARLWTARGADALSYLTGPLRGLRTETIRAARLGWVSDLEVLTSDGDRYYRVTGIVIPWFDDGGRLTLAKVRQPEGRKPKYAEIFRDPSRVICYPGPGVIVPGRPLIAVEGELDAMLLGQELGDLASVVTTGSASTRPTPELRLRAYVAPRWYTAHDADAAGDKAAGAWPARARRVRPPVIKDWTDTRAHGVDLARWWGDILAGVEQPSLFTPAELASWRWGNEETGDGRAMDPAADPYAALEREAIKWADGL